MFGEDRSARVCNGNDRHAKKRNGLLRTESEQNKTKQKTHPCIQFNSIEKVRERKWSKNKTNKSWIRLCTSPPLLLLSLFFFSPLEKAYVRALTKTVTKTVPPCVKR